MQITSKDSILSHDEISRYSRHLLIPQIGLSGQEKLKQSSVLVVGTGGLGSPVSMYLAAAGVGRIGLVDFDIVDLTNITTQGYLAGDVDRPKVLATTEAIHRLDTSIDVTAVQDRYRAKLEIGDAVFCCVDSIAARAAIWRSARSRSA